MKKLTTLLLSLLITATVAIAGTPVQMEIGSELPATKQTFKDVSGSDLNLKDIAQENGLLVIFTCNSCPYVIAWQDRYPDISAFCKENNIGLVMLNPNEARRTSSDSYEMMQSHAKENSYDFYYALDQNHAFADALGATKTPDVFLFDADLKLAYKGAIDDNHKDATAVQESFLNEAMKNLLAGAEINPNTTRAIGCSIKRVQ